MKLEKKTVKYHDAMGGDQTAAYVIIGRDCVFSGLGPPGTSINFAEEIIILICEAEGLDPQRITFYDLQTHRSYRSKREGQYELDKLTLEFGEGHHGFYATTWTPAPKWPLILEVFAEEIGGSGDPVNVSRRPAD